MKPQSTSLFSLLFLLLLPRPSLLFSLNNCTIDFFDESKVVCDEHRLTTVPSDIPKSATYLSLLNNNILRIRRTELTGFTRLETLDLGNNNISHIEDGAFSDLSALTELSLFNNKLFALTDDMFKGLSSLMILNLGRNLLKSIAPLTFIPLNNLQELNLSNNKFIQILQIVFKIPSLKVLNLKKIHLTSFESDFFPFPLLNLTKLVLSSNPLRKFRVHSDVFPRLESLDLSEIRSEVKWDVSDKAFLRSLRTLDLSWTEFTLETYQIIFQSVDSVRKLYLRGLGRMKDRGLLDLACGIPSLQKLDLSGNYIPLLKDTLLQPCTDLTELTLSENMMWDLAESSLRMLTRLTRLKIESNGLPRVPLTVRNMSSLTLLSFQENEITELQCLDFSNVFMLTELNLMTNHISELRVCVFKDLKGLKVLNVQNNLISKLDGSFGLSLPSLVTFNMNGNNLGLLHEGTFHNMSSLTELNLKSKSKTFLEAGALEGLLNLKTLIFSPYVLFKMTFKDMTQLESLVILFLNSDDNLRNLADDGLTSPNLPTLLKLSMKAENEMSECTHWTKSVINLDHLQIFSMDRFCCTDPKTFHYTPLLINLQMINCAKFSPGPELFQPIPELQSLDLSQNHLKSLDFLSEANLTKLEKLVLVNNELMVINETVFEALPSLKYLDLSGNPFACNCSNAGFIQWAIRNKQVYVVGAFQYRCSSPLSHEGHFLLDFNVQSCWEFTAFLCFISSSALVLLTLLSSFIYHFLRWQLVYGFYLLLAFLYHSKKRRQGCPHIYDAFVSYNVHDEDWVYGELLPELEGRQGWRLCLHHRDFEPGKPIVENITDAIYSSRKTLCVISRRYLQSEWCSQEIQMASFRLFDEQKDVLILLFLEQISSNQLSPFYRMRKLVKSRTYLSWTQAHSHKGLFWEKVRWALESGHEPGDNHNPLTANV